ncbi:hypothetical protein [Novosphingobium guangzhouense]|uniref:Uncharacterized protein n=1 Tax=Novosphingobium guangzhouense TaxID=1850347 RepID=A0A2K2G0M2_9SPHN|nr:hypothetical protein [Novosphingobium guangzhouense]PNU04600.1 hypothetical protein A8V01_19520 [Novosphingobium guangzhouense]
MSTLIHDALQSRIPHQAKRYPDKAGTRHEFNCPLCGDKRRRGRIYLNDDGSCGCDCKNCYNASRQETDKPLTKKLEKLLVALGMSGDEIRRLKYDVWRERILAQNSPSVTKQPLPDGARPIGDWIADNIADPNFNDLLEDLADMDPDHRDGYYWTPEAGTTGDMNRRYIWVVGDPELPDAWAAHTIDDDEEVDTIVGDPDAWVASLDEEDEPAFDTPEINRSE